MCESDDSALRLSPFQDRKIPGGPIFDLPRIRIVLVSQPQQHEMAAMTGWESGHLEIVTKQSGGDGNLIVLSFEILPLMVVTGPPIQDRSNAKSLPQNLAHHIFRTYAFGGTLVMRAT